MDIGNGGLPPKSGRDKSPNNPIDSHRMSQGNNGTPTPVGVDSGDARAMVGKTPEEIKLIKMMR